MPQTILEIKDLKKTYRSNHLGKPIIKEALKGITLTVEHNTVFSLIGLNGSGKTTTIKLLLGLISPDKGSFTMFGESIINNKVKERIGYLPEMPYFNGEFTPKEMLKFWGRLSGVDSTTLDDRIIEVLRYTSLEDTIDRRIKGFSRGMKQRLGLAQALLSSPDFLILDEPMGGLDPKGIIDIRALILKLKDDGKTVFFSSHIISEVIKVADIIGIIHDGRILKTLEPHENLEEEFLEITGLNLDNA